MGDSAGFLNVPKIKVGFTALWVGCGLGELLFGPCVRRGMAGGTVPSLEKASRLLLAVSR